MPYINFSASCKAHNKEYLGVNMLPWRHRWGCRLCLFQGSKCAQTGGAQLNAAGLMHGPLEIILPNTEIIHLCFWSHLNQIQEPGSCFESDAILRTDGLTCTTFLRWIIHKHVHFDTAGQVTNISYLSIPKHLPAMEMIPWYSIFFAT